MTVGYHRLILFPCLYFALSFYVFVTVYLFIFFTHTHTICLQFNGSHFYADKYFVLHSIAKTGFHLHQSNTHYKIFEKKNEWNYLNELYEITSQLVPTNDKNCIESKLKHQKYSLMGFAYIIITWFLWQGKLYLVGCFRFVKYFSVLWFSFDVKQEQGRSCFVQAKVFCYIYYLWVGFMLIWWYSCPFTVVLN